MRRLGIVLIILLCLVIAAAVAKDAIIRNSIKGIISITTGLKVNIGELKTSVAETYISINNVVVLNPPDFNDKIMLDIPEIYIDYDLPSLFKKNIHLYNMRINLKEVTIIKDRYGKINLDYLKGLKREESRERQDDRSRKTGFLIDSLSLKIGKVIYKDYSVRQEPVVSEYKINIDSQYRNVRDIKEIVRIMLAKAVLSTAIGNLSDFRKFRDIGSDAIESGKNILQKTISELKDIIKAPFKKEAQDDR